MLRVRQNQSRSWFNHHYARKLSYELANRLVERCRGHKGVFVTLTYRPDDWANPKELFEASSRERHVRLFIRRLSNILDEDLNGRWLCKLEFQKNGHVHFHLIILGLKYIPHACLEHCWGHGFVWVNTLRAQRLRYLCKYVSKSDELPAFILAEPQRSVKIVRTSPGFWRNDSTPASEAVPRDSPKLPIYISIGEAVERAERSTTLNDDDTGRYATVPRTLYTVLTRLIDDGCSVVGSDHGWLVLDVAMDYAVRRFAGIPRPQGRGPGTGGVHLKEDSNPHIRRHRWVDAVLEEAFTWLKSQSVGGKAVA